MPVVSPSRYSSTLSGSYRSTLAPNSTLDNPYYRTSSGTYVSSTLRSTYGDRTTEYRTRYSDVDGKRERKSSLVEYSRTSRAPSGDSDSGISTRYRSDRSESRGRDISTTRSESSKTSNDRAARKSALNSAALAMSTAELYNKYSPANYIPLTQRIQQAAQSNYGEISRSKSISNDIGRPPVSETRLRRPRNSTAATIVERPERRYKETSPSPSYSKRNSMTNGIKDSNGNDVPSVSEIRKRFDQKMAVTKLPTNEPRYGRSPVEHYLSQLKDCENGTDGYTRVKQEKPVPIHLPYEKNGYNRWDSGSSSRSDSNSDLSISRTLSEPVPAKPVHDKSNDVTVSLTARLPSERLASIKSQLDPNNPIGKILEKSTVIHVENGEAKRFSPDKNGETKRFSPEKNSEARRPSLDTKKTGETKRFVLAKTGENRRAIVNKHDEAKRITPEKNGETKKVSPDKNSEAIRVSPGKNVEKRLSPDKIKEKQTEIEKQVKPTKHTSNFASYIQISQPIASGTSRSSSREKEVVADDEPPKEGTETRTSRDLKYIDSSEEQDKLVLENETEIESPSSTGFENKTFEHENYLKKRSESRENEREDQKEEDEGVKSMETSTESTFSEDSSPETPSSRRKVLDAQDIEDIKAELAGGKSGPSGLRRSSERSDTSTETRAERKPSHTSGLNGLRNIGNTCFMNSVLQCLSNTRPLLEYVTEDKYSNDINTTLSCMKGALFKAFASLIKELWRSGDRDGVVNTTTFKSQVQRFAPRFMGYSQQDAQEFLRYLLEGMHEDVNRVTVKPKPILTEIDDTLSDSAKAAEAWSRYLRMEDSRVGDIFVGQLKSTLRCTHCHHDSVTFDPFWDLSLPIPSRTGNLKLQQCLQHFTKEEEMDGDEKPTCSKCGVRRKCLKWFIVQKFPQVLVLHLKRFSPTERFRGKLSVVVEFPLNGLDMSPYAATRGSPVSYNLYAVSNHSGTTYSGHYTAYCKHPYTGDWHEYNDSRVSPINPRDVVSSEAYVLFYELARNPRDS